MRYLEENVTVCFFNFGCKVNSYETQLMRESFAVAGFTESEASSADVYVINSCTVTSQADSKVAKLINRLRRTSPLGVIVLTGCLPQTGEVPKSMADKVDIMSGVTDRELLPQRVRAFLSGGAETVDIPPTPTVYKQAPISRFSGHTRAFVKIQEGCHRQCSYCIIPKARGAARSRSPEDIAAEVATLTKSGYREFVLSGTNLAAFGVDTGLTLFDAVEAAAYATDSSSRIRLGSVEFDLVSDSVTESIVNHPMVCPHWHLPLQSGCDRTLRHMGRQYNTDMFRERLKLLRSLRDDIAVSTDIIVGFPGESESDFQESMAFAVECGFSDTHIFPFSERKGTAAAEMSGRLTAAMKADRAAEAERILTERKADYLATHIGKLRDVLVEKSGVVGYSEHYLRVKLDRKCTPGDIVRVLITDVKSGVLHGSISR